MAGASGSRSARRAALMAAAYMRHDSTQAADPHLKRLRSMQRVDTSFSILAAVAATANVVSAVRTGSYVHIGEAMYAATYSGAYALAALGLKDMRTRIEALERPQATVASDTTIHTAEMAVSAQHNSGLITGEQPKEPVLPPSYLDDQTVVDTRHGAERLAFSVMAMTGFHGIHGVLTE